MADHRDNGRTFHRAALILLALGLLEHYGYVPAPAWAQPDVQNICRAAVQSALMLWLTWRWRSWHVVGVVAYLLAEQILVVGCSGMYLYLGAPATLPGDQCTGLIGFDLGSVGVFVASCLLVWILRRRNL